MALFRRLTQKFHRDDPGQLRREIRWLLGKMASFAPGIGKVAALGFLGTLMSLASSVASKYLIDAVTGLGTGSIGAAALALGILSLGGLALQAVSSRISAGVHIQVRQQLQFTGYRRILTAKWEALEGFPSGDLLSRIHADVDAVAGGIIGFLPGLAVNGLRFAGAFAIIFFYDPVMALIALAGVPVTLAVSRYLMGRLRGHSQQMKTLAGQVMSFQEDSLRNLTSIKSFSAADLFSGEMHRLQDVYAGEFLTFQSFQIRMSTALSALSMAVSTSCFAWGVYRLWAGEITYGSMTMFLQLASALRGAFSGLVSLAQQAISLTTSAGRLLAVEELPQEDARVPEGLSREETLEIRLEGVEFHYQNGEELLHSFDFSAGHNAQVAIIGPSGEGKTTLLRLLLGLVEPGTGKAVLTGGSGEEYAIGPGTRGAFAYVPQGNSVFSGTVAQNLRLTKPEASEEELIRALKTACAWDFVKALPGQLNYELGAGGRGISEGQAQRLAIARALLRKAPILLLDEATSGLDPRTEEQLLENLRGSGLVHTCILVTHRPATAAFCGKVYEIREGYVMEAAHV